MLYLSRLILSLNTKTVQHDLRDCYKLHQRVLHAFSDAVPGTNGREHFGVLYRVESFERDPWLMRLLVQSAVEPDWSRLPDGYLGEAPDARGNPAVRLVESEYAQVQAGMPLRFRLRANPTRRISNRNTEQDERWRGKRVELHCEEDQLAWLARKGDQGGFRLIGVQVHPDVLDTRVTTEAKTRGRRPAHNGGSPMALRFGSVLFEGHLEVTDRATFLETLRTGIGSGKSFGFGLLSIASVG